MNFRDRQELSNADVLTVFTKTLPDGTEVALVLMGNNHVTKRGYSLDNLLQQLELPLTHEAATNGEEDNQLPF